MSTTTPTPTGHKTLADLRRTLPQKRTMRLAEVAEWLGISRRQAEYYAADGTLLTINTSRKGVRRRNTRVVVRLERAFDPQRKNFLTLEEMIMRSSNILAP
ncbi:MAG: hypothetical protein M0Q49_01995 [Porticoccaceae bacterium]|nr:hypothetical protein [Porticoccaceae bacterium]